MYAVIRQYRGKVPSIVSDTFKVLTDDVDAEPPNNRCFIGSTLLTEETATTGGYASQPPLALHRDDWAYQQSSPWVTQNASRTAVSMLVGNAVCNSENVRVASG
jgi:hypothetical protein